MARQLIDQYQIHVGADSSSVTGTPWYVGDFRQLTISITTGSAHASRITVQGSNADGFQSTLSAGGGYGNATVPVWPWSHLTVILPSAAANIFTIDPGFRWIVCTRPTATSGQTASNITIILNGRT